MTPKKKQQQADTDPADELTVEYMPLDELVSADYNAKGHDEKYVAASFDRYGYAEPIVLDERTGKIVAGHGRRDVLLDKQTSGAEPPRGVRISDGRWFAPVVRGWRSANDEEALAAGVDFNRSTEAGGWDWKAVLDDLGTLDVEALPIGFGVDDLSDLRDMLGNLDSLDEQQKKVGEPGERDFWPKITLRVSPDTKKRYDTIMQALDLDDDEKIATALLDAYEHEARPQL